MNLEAVLPALRRAGLLLDHTPRSVRFQRLTACLLQALSDSAAIPALSAGDIQRYSTLALLHDIGMRTVPREILEKPGSLTREEFLTVKAHTTQGCGLLEGVPELRECGVLPDVCDVCRHHHERWDGSGYPDRLAGPEITPWVQVGGLADAFDALVHPRIRKPALPPAQAAGMIRRGACGVFDPRLMACFARHLGPISRAAYSSTG